MNYWTYMPVWNSFSGRWNYILYRSFRKYYKRGSNKPEDWAYMSKYSPYQNVKSGVRYPPTFFYLSTKDDRVHPGHARKMFAKLGGTGSTVYFHEYLEGGHSVGADKSEDAMRAALLWAFLTKEIGQQER